MSTLHLLENSSRTRHTRLLIQLHTMYRTSIAAIRRIRSLSACSMPMEHSQLLNQQSQSVVHYQRTHSLKLLMATSGSICTPFQVARSRSSSQQNGCQSSENQPCSHHL